jgi:glutathione synthase/RimK-type ligase-like ATP-grasp enzyme
LVETSLQDSTLEAPHPLIAVVAESRYVAPHQPWGLCAALVRAGYTPLILNPEDPAGPPLENIDLIVARGRSPRLLSLLARAEGLGVRTVNRCSAIVSARDRVGMSRKLARGGLATPAAKCGTLASIAEAFQAGEYPLIIKPVFDNEDVAVHIVHDRDQLLALPRPGQLAVAQRVVAGTGVDLKLYVAGSEVFAARQPSPLAGHPAAPPVPVPVSEELNELALRCGSLFGLEIFGVTCVETGAGAMVIGVNAFPDSFGIPGASESLARYVIGRADARFKMRQQSRLK